MVSTILILGIAFLGLFIILVAAFVAIVKLGGRLKQSLATISGELNQLEKQTAQYRTFATYLQRKERTILQFVVDPMARRLDSTRRRGWLMDSDSKTLLDSLTSRCLSLKGFLDTYLSGYVSHEAERHRDFFKKMGLNSEQATAVVMNDVYNLTVAAAGSGKTRALTSRIALLVDSGVPPDKILALAYTRIAAHEMEERLQNQFGINSVKVKTIHSFSRELARSSPDFRTDVADEGVQGKIIREAAEKLASRDRIFAVNLLAFAVDFRRPEEEQQSAFANALQYYEYQRRQEYETLNLVKVKSKAERDIGNFLFLQGVQFEYEARAGWAENDPHYRDYHPDFFLPDYNIWIEHWAVDRQGNVPEWFEGGEGLTPSERYRKGMEWKKEQFRKRNQKLIETFHYQWKEDALIPELRRQLESNGVLLREVPLEEILKRIVSMIGRDPLYELMFSFISKGKTNGLSSSDVESRLADGRNWSRKQRSFASLMIPIWRAYELELRERNMLDFNDMITLALKAAQGNGAGDYAHVLVDEFQDITDPQLELVRRLVPDAQSGKTLFCVGDHRQNIFSYAGSNVHNIIDFDKIFPYPERTSLSTNYRCPKNIVELSNAVIAAGIYHDRPAIAASSVVQPIQVIEKTGAYPYEKWEQNAAKETISNILATRKPSETILVLARYRFRLRPLMLEFPGHESEGIRFKSIHAAKGTEADYVLLLGCVGGLHGFPSKILDENLLDIVENLKQDKKEKLEEERRLFYVALTRCRKKLYLFTSKTNKSQFLPEIDAYLRPPGQPVQGVGICIRCGRRIKFNLKRPLCDNCYGVWARYRNRNYSESYCHSCGKSVTTTLARPLCIECYKKAH